jgi:tryptophan-rich sensory protein
MSTSRNGPARLPLPLDGLLLVGFLVVSLGVAVTASWFTIPNIPGWYASLEKPSWTPPNWLFGPVWTTLYLMMAVAAWLVARDRSASTGRRALLFWGVQLVLNFFWSLLFFHWQRIDLALIDIVALWGMIVVTIVAFWRLNRLAALLLVPYLVWVSYATALNFAIYGMNP